MRLSPLLRLLLHASYKYYTGSWVNGNYQMAFHIAYVATPYMVNASKLANRLIMNCINLSIVLILYVFSPELI